MTESPLVSATVLDGPNFPTWAGGNNSVSAAPDCSGNEIGSWTRIMDRNYYLNRKVNSSPAMAEADLSFGSQHPGGALFVLADGSTRFFSEDVDTAIYHMLGNRHDGMAIVAVE